MAHTKTIFIAGLIWALFAGFLFGAQGQDAAFPPAAPESQGISQAALEQLAKKVQTYLEEGQIVGAELLVIKNRRTVFHKAFGMRDREENLPWELNTRCNIRSMTKPITGAGIQILIDEGKVKLTDKAADFLPGFNNEKSKSITIEQLLTHQSGLPLSILLTAASMDEFKNLLEIGNAVGNKGPEFEPGSKFWYSDAGTDVLGAITEVASKMTLNEFRKKKLLEPLGMKDTFTMSKENKNPKERVASLYVGSPGAWRKFWTYSDEPFYPFAWGSQTLYSTPMDYAKFLAMWMDGGMAGGERILSEEAVSRTVKPAILMSSLGSDAPFPSGFPNHKVYYGQMAVVYTDSKAADPKKPVIIGHSGSDGTYAWAWPDLDLMVLYFTQSRGGLSGIRLETEIYKTLINPSFKAEEVPEKYKPFIGDYIANFGPFKDTKFPVLMQNGSLAIDIPGRMIFELTEPDKDGWRFFKLTNAIRLRFSKDESGKVKELRMKETSRLPRKSGLEETEEKVPEQYRALLGQYTIPMANAVVEIVLQGDALGAEIPGIGTLKLIKDENGKDWCDENNKNFKVSFDRNESGEVTTLIIIQTRVLPKGE